MNHCANTSALNAYLKQMDRADRIEQAIVMRTQQILDQGGYCSDRDSIAEAVAESMYGNNAEVLINALLRCMGDKITDKNALSLSMVVSGAVKAYWYAAARKQAEDEINAASCTICFDAGCPTCDPAERE